MSRRVREASRLPLLTAPPAYDQTNEQQTRAAIEDRLRSADALRGLPQIGTSGYALISDGTDPQWTGFAQSGTGATTRTWMAKMREAALSVTDFGVTLDGSTDDTANYQLAVNEAISSGRPLIQPPGTAILSQVSVAGSLTLIGHPGAVVKHKASSTGGMFVPTGSGTTVRFEGLTFDGNYANQAAEALNWDIYSIADGSSSPQTQSHRLTVIDCTFKNTSYAAIRCEGDQSGSTREVLHVERCQFRGGADGVENAGTDYIPRDVDIVDGVEAWVLNSWFHSDAQPAIGRCGVVVATQATGDPIYSDIYVIGNHFNYRGCPVSTGIGAVDIYIWGNDCVIRDNVFQNSMNSPMRWKANTERLHVVGNTVDTMLAERAVINGNSPNYGTAGDGIIIADNIIANCTGNASIGQIIAYSGLWRIVAACATTANITLSGEQTIDGVLTSGSVVLVKNQSTSSQNGVWITSSGAWTRSPELDSWTEVVTGAVQVVAGTTQAGTWWKSTSASSGTIGVTAITWASATLAELDYSKGVVIKGNQLINCNARFGIEVSYSRDVTIEDNHILPGTIDIGITLGNGNNDGTFRIRDNYIGAVGTYAFFTANNSATFDLEFCDNTLVGPASGYAGYFTGRYLTIKGNEIRGGVNGFNVDACTDVVLNNNILRNMSGTVGFNIGGAVTNFTARGNSALGLTYPFLPSTVPTNLYESGNSWSPPVQSITAASSAVTNTALTTKFDKSITIPAYRLRVGMVIKIKAQGIATATHTTDTLTTTLFIGGTGGTTLVSCAANDVADNDIFWMEYHLTVRAVGASGSIVGIGSAKATPGGEGVTTIAFKDNYLPATTIDTTTTQEVCVTATWSVADAGNSCRLDVLTVEYVY